MRRFFIKVCLFLFLIVVIDQFFGFAMGEVSKKIDKGGVGRDNFICDIVTDDILIFGSSRAEHHYNAQMITDSLGTSCYNCGETGSGIILAYGRLLMLQERYTPKVILYEVTPGYDYLDDKDNKGNLYRLKQHYDRAGIDSIFWDIDPTEKYKMISGMYRHNSSFLQNLIVYFFGMSAETGIRGFRPYYEKMDTMRIRRKDHIVYDSKNGYKYDTLKLGYIDKFLDKTKNMKLVFVVSPTWYGQDSLVLAPMKEICKKRNAYLIDFSNDPRFVHQNEYFKDGTHLNALGADEFTRALIHEIRKRKILN